MEASARHSISIRAKTATTMGLVVAALAPLIWFVGAAAARRWIDDDGFINLRIVRNLLSGQGPVYNLGERVEVGTSPLWIGLLAMLGATGARLEYLAVGAGLVLATLGLAFGQ